MATHQWFFLGFIAIFILPMAIILWATCLGMVKQIMEEGGFKF